MSYGLDFRQRVLHEQEKRGLSIRGIARHFGLSPNTVFLWTKRLAPKLTRDRPAIKIDMDKLRQDIIDTPDAYAYERAERFNVSDTGIRRALKRLGVTYKKNSESSQSGSRRTLCILPEDRES